MLLQQLELRNIRSYETASITFPESSTLLAGDIGCGKSSILLAVEFALFGTSRPDLPGEALLRKGTTKGEVTLTFRLGKKEITINRKLKKEKQGIKQLPGSVIINNVKRELTPVELKAEIISLLGYPIEFISKNKNYIFRYTVYTPQEEMKQILQDHPETRLDVLRKIFNIDKYRQIRENAQLFLKQQRVRLAVSQSKIEPLPERKQQLRDVGMNLEDVGKQLLVAQPLLTKLREQIFRLQQKISSVEEQQQKYVTLQQQTQQLKILIEQKQLQLQQSHQQEEMLTLQIAEFDFPQGDNLDKVQERVHQLEQAHQTWLTQKMEYEKNIQQCQQQLQRITEQLATLDNVEKRLMQEKENITNHTQALTEKNAIEEQEKEVVRQLQHVSEQRAQQEVILQQAKTTKMRILTLNHCPQCLQEVHEQHKSSIVMQEENKISAAQVLVQEYVVNEKKLQVLRDEVQIRLQSLQKKQQQLLVAENEIKQLEKQREQQNALQTEQKATTCCP
jgi:DNA repair protein SbcC/Rad50